jgi:DNA-binding GntR family transcriptional regulator
MDVDQISGPPPQRVTSDSAYDQIRNAILDGTLEPGAQLVESAVAQWCGVSRTPVREALKRLEHDGLVGRGERGLIVKERTPDEIMDLYHVRIVLEESAARFAAERHRPFDLVRLERAMRACEEVDETDGAALATANREFHMALWEAAHNEPLRDLLDRLNLHLGRFPATTLSYPGRWEEALGEHSAVVDAIRGRDVDEAGAVARGHFTAARDIRLALFMES